jgi:hypothetical protein
VIHSQRKTSDELQVSLPLIKQHLRITHNDDDIVINHYASVAQAYIQDQTGLCFYPATWEYTWPCWDNVNVSVPATLQVNALNWHAVDPVIQLDRRPLTTINSIKYYDHTDTQQTLDSDQYEVSYDPFARIVFTNPPQLANRVDGVTINYTCGCDIPLQATQAILLLTGHYYEHRETVSETPLHDVPQAVEMLLRQLMVWEV